MFNNQEVMTNFKQIKINMTKNETLYFSPFDFLCKFEAKVFTLELQTPSPFMKQPPAADQKAE